MGSSEESAFLSLAGQVLVLFLIAVLIILAVFGNIALLFAMYTQPKLRTTSNLFIGRFVNYFYFHVSLKLF